MDERKEKYLLILSNKQCITILKKYRKGNGRKCDSLTTLTDSTLVSFGIDRPRYHGDDLEETSIIKLFQNTNNIFQVFQTKIKTIVTNDSI